MKYVLIVGVLACIVVAYLNSNDIDVNQQKWSCTKSECSVEFRIVNLTDITQNIMYRVKAYNISTGSKYSGGSVQPIYDRREKITLEANQSTKFEEAFRPARSPNNVNVTAWIIKETI